MSKCLKIFSDFNVAVEAIAVFRLVYFIIDFVRKWLRELAFFLDHFTSFNWNLESKKLQN